jgi:hypothetical protein
MSKFPEGIFNDSDENYADHDSDEFRFRNLTSRRSGFGAYRPVPMWNGQPVSQMDDQHLVSAASYCERKFVERKEIFEKAYPGQPYYFQSVADMWSEYGNLLREIERRR